MMNLGATYSNDGTKIHIDKYIQDRKEIMTNAARVTFSHFANGAHDSNIDVKTLTVKLERLIRNLYSGAWAKSQFEVIEGDLKRFTKFDRSKIPLENVPLSYHSYVTEEDIEKNITVADVQNIIKMCSNQLERNREKLLQLSKTNNCFQVPLLEEEESEQKHLDGLSKQYEGFLQYNDPIMFDSFVNNVNSFMFERNERLLKSIEVCTKTFA